MKLNQKEARIVPARAKSFFRESEEGYTYLQHGDVYAISLANETNEDNDVSIEIDGKRVGVWRLNANSTATIERSADDRGCFTFYELGSVEAVQTDLASVPKQSLGLVQVTFVPKKASGMGAAVVDSHLGAKGIGGSFSSSRRGCGQSLNAGGTGLSGRSEQEFGRAMPMELDYDRATIISLRLVAEKNNPRPLRAVGSAIANLVPPPVN